MKHQAEIDRLQAAIEAGTFCAISCRPRGRGHSGPHLVREDDPDLNGGLVAGEIVISPDVAPLIVRALQEGPECVLPLRLMQVGGSDAQFGGLRAPPGVWFLVSDPAGDARVFWDTVNRAGSLASTHVTARFPGKRDRWNRTCLCEVGPEAGLPFWGPSLPPVNPVWEPAPRVPHNISLL